MSDLQTGDMLDGIYVPVGYWDLLIQSGKLRGPRGGLNVSYASVPRHISKTEIMDLVRSGWIGSSGSRTEQITDVIRSALEAGRSVLMAGLTHQRY